MKKPPGVHSEAAFFEGHRRVCRVAKALKTFKAPSARRRVRISVIDHRRYNALLDEEKGLLGDLAELEAGTVEWQPVMRSLAAIHDRQNSLLTDLGITERAL